MSSEQTLEVEIFDVTFGNDVGQQTMMVYESGGVKCVTFAVPDDDGFWTPGPFPLHLLECSSCMEDFVSALREKGLTLVQAPEQRLRSS